MSAVHLDRPPLTSLADLTAPFGLDPGEAEPLRAASRHVVPGFAVTLTTRAPAPVLRTRTVAPVTMRWPPSAGGRNTTVVPLAAFAVIAKVCFRGSSASDTSSPASATG